MDRTPGTVLLDSASLAGLSGTLPSRNLAKLASAVLRSDPHTVEAAGSNPAAPTKDNARLAGFHGRPAFAGYTNGYGFSLLQGGA